MCGLLKYLQKKNAAQDCAMVSNESYKVLNKNSFYIGNTDRGNGTWEFSVDYSVDRANLGSGEAKPPPVSVNVHTSTSQTRTTVHAVDMKCKKRIAFLQKFSNGVTENAREIKEATKKQEEERKNKIET